VDNSSEDSLHKDHFKRNNGIYLKSYPNLIAYRIDTYYNLRIILSASGGIGMNTVAEQEIMERGMKAVDENIEEGPVYIIKDNKPQYVILSEKLYRDLIEELSAAYVAWISASLKDVDANRIHAFKNTEDLLRAIAKED
jgi:PHD/YefM family antitoxin component YafN of YafNO toxin-antitoxin module